ncbi:MAG: hypothetical protein IBX68_01235 [Dehalococcoidia bacterium]|nr:hypothetical protein [Dehalococcoidia bacterium]
MRIIGAFLLIAGGVTALGSILYWFVTAIIDFLPLVLKAAIVAAIVGFVLLMVSLIRERVRASKTEEFKEVER